MNRILTKRPDDTPDTYVFGVPGWFVLAFRCTLLFVGCVAAVLVTKHWSAMPLTTRVLAALLIPALITSPIWSGPWTYTVKFMANETGIYFPSYPQLTLAPKVLQPEAWLEVPWKHIANIRLASEAGEYGNCVAFDIRIETKEESRFFEAVGTPRDRSKQKNKTLSVAYGGWPPSPAYGVQQLLHLQLRHAAQ